ncbi:hypothetical protein HDZ31DRAFT_66138 [Schizophyllum fasciatum]
MADASLPEPSSAMDTSPDSGGGPVADPMSLRAAALMTLKSKRRKPADPAALPPSLPQRPQTTFDMLDYGGTEPTPPKPQPQQSVPTSDPGSREEGEISESEEAGQAAPSSTEPPQPLRAALPPKPVLPESPTTPTAHLPEISTPSLLDRIAGPSRVQAAPFPNQVSPTVQQRRPSKAAPPPAVPDVMIDAQHVRPGLTITQEQYDATKVMILDLLGWGIHPDLLHPMGLSREIIYYVFSELNLRFPANLDTTGLIPYTPNMQRPELPSQRNVHHSLPPKPPPLVIPGRPGPQPVRNMQEHEDAPSAALLNMEQQRRQELLARKRKGPVKPQRIRGESDVEMRPPVTNDEVEDFLQSIAPGPSAQLPPKPTFAPAGPSTLTPSSSYYEDDMDIDEIPGLSSSRAEPPPASRPAPPAPRQVPKPVAVANPVPPAPKPATIPKPPPPVPKPVAEPHVAPKPPAPTAAPVPSPASTSTAKAAGQAPTRAQVTTVVQPETTDPQRNEAGAAPAMKASVGQPQAITPGNGTPLATPAPNTAVPQSNGSAMNHNGAGPRGKKRPVAMDFVDAEERRPHRPPPRDPTRANCFAGGVGTMKRFVIELSDTEDDAQHGGRHSPALSDGQPIGSALARTMPTLAQPTPTLPLTMMGEAITGLPMLGAPVAAAKALAAGANGQGSPRLPAVAATAGTPTELDLQIRRLKEKIANAELKLKQARPAQAQEASNAGTPTSTTPLPPSAGASPRVPPSVAASPVVAPSPSASKPKPIVDVSATPKPVPDAPVLEAHEASVADYFGATTVATPNSTPKPDAVKTPSTLQATAPVFQPAKSSASFLARLWILLMQCRQVTTPSITHPATSEGDATPAPATATGHLISLPAVDTSS